MKFLLLLFPLFHQNLIFDIEMLMEKPKITTSCPQRSDFLGTRDKFEDYYSLLTILPKTAESPVMSDPKVNFLKSKNFTWLYKTKSFKDVV